MNKYGLISIFTFLISGLVYFSSMFNGSGEEILSGPGMILLVIVLPFIGLFIAFKSKGLLKAAGITGNCLILLFSAVLPYASTFFWNQP